MKSAKKLGDRILHPKEKSQAPGDTTEIPPLHIVHHHDAGNSPSHDSSLSARSPPPSPIPRVRSGRTGSMSSESIVAMRENARAISRSQSSSYSSHSDDLTRSPDQRQRRPSAALDQTLQRRSGQKPSNRMIPLPSTSAVVAANTPTIVDSVFVLEHPRRVVCWITKDGQPPHPDYIALAVPMWQEIPILQRHNGALDDASLGRLSRPRESIASSKSMFVTVKDYGETSSVYICSARVRCILNEPPAMMRGMQHASNASEHYPADSTIRESYRFFVICSRLPYFQLFWQMLDKMFDIEHRHTVEILTRSWAPGRTSEALQHAEAMGKLFYNGAEGRCWLTIPELPVPESAPLKATRFTSKRLNTEFSFAPIRLDSDGVSAQLSSISMAALMRSFCAPDLVTLIAAMLLEYPLVIVGSQCGRVSAVCIALMTLARPMIYCAPCVPMLPPSLHDAIDSPTGGIFGVVTQNEGSVNDYWPTISANRLDSTVFALLDNNALHIPPGFPMIPASGCLSNALDRPMEHVRTLSGQNKENQDLFAWEYPEACVEHIATFTTAVGCYLHWLTGKIRQNLPGGAYSERLPMMEAKTIKTIAGLFRSENSEFMRQFMASQMYNTYAAGFAEFPPVDSADFGNFMLQPL